MLCHCGEPLHYTSQKIKALIDKLVEQKGEYVRVVWRNRAWWVSRHYIALHGIKGKELKDHGFTEAPMPWEGA